MTVKTLLKRLFVSVRFRLQPFIKQYKKSVVGPVRSKHGSISRQLEYPLGLFSPNRKKEIFISRPSALGDVLMCTPALREFKKQNPDIKIHFFTNYEQLVRGLPYIDEVHSYDKRPWDGIEFKYEDSIPPMRHITEIFADQLNIEVTDVLPDCILPKREMEIISSRFYTLPRPWFVINRTAGPWTPNKDWDNNYWDRLISCLLNLGSVFELGMGSVSRALPRPNYINLVGKTSLSEMIALIASADVNMGPVSGPIHIAAAVKVPSVVIYGGYELASCSEYPLNINLTTPLDCSPCWLRSPCPIGKQCLSAIGPEQVLESVEKILNQKQLITQPNSKVLRHAQISV